MRIALLCSQQEIEQAYFMFQNVVFEKLKCVEFF